MGLMTDHTPLYLLGLVFIYPGASLFWMALEAGLIFCDEACLSEACPFAGPVGGVTVRTLQGSLEYLVGVRQIEFRLHLLVAGETEVNFSGLQMILAHRDPVDLMTIITSDSA